MGGHNAGANASRLAVTTIRYMYLFLDTSVHNQITGDLIAMDFNIASRLIGSIRLTNRNIFNKSIQESNLRGMGTTVSALAICDNLAIIAHVGDSRIYRIRQDTMNLLTEDHTWINELIQDQELDREEAKKFEKKNVITRALGLNGAIKIDVGIEPVQQDDLFLICTDGLNKALSDKEIERIVLFNNGNLDHTLRHLIDTAMMRDGSDNITVALVAIEELEPDIRDYQPIYVILKAENKQTTYLEDKILKRELYNRSNSDSSENSITKIFKKHYSKLSWIVAILMLVVFVGVYAFSNHRYRQKLSQNAVTLYNTLSKNNYNDSIKISGVSGSEINSEQTGQSLQIESKAVPDSIVNKLITASFENQDYTAPVLNIRSRPLRRNTDNRGKIYLAGLENLKNFSNSSLFINDKRWGRSKDLWNKGLLLQPGTYTIVIRDSTKKILFQQTNIIVSAGDIKAIEIKGR
jgi:serine/threonine protein phosphatase PrpC